MVAATIMMMLLVGRISVKVDRISLVWSKVNCLIKIAAIDIIAKINVSTDIITFPPSINLIYSVYRSSAIESLVKISKLSIN